MNEKFFVGNFILFFHQSLFSSLFFVFFVFISHHLPFQMNGAVPTWDAQRKKLSACGSIRATAKEIGKHWVSGTATNPSTTNCGTV
jgi:hypothetical protein